MPPKSPLPTPNPVPTGEVLVAPTPNSFGVAKQGPPTKLIVGIIVLVILLGGGAAGLLIVPKTLTAKFASDLKPKLSSLKSSTKAVQISIDQIHFAITNEGDPNKSEGLQTSGLLIHPQIASLQVSSNVLGSSTKNASGLVEQSVVGVSNSVQGSIKNLIGSKVAGTTTTAAGESPSMGILRTVKDITLKAGDNVSKAQTDLSAVSSQINSPPVLLTSDAKQKIVNDPSLSQDIKPYLDQSKKVSGYYQTLSDMLITMNLKITSFKDSLSLTSKTFAQIDNPNLSDSQLKSILDQSQVYLNQAKKDTDELKKLSNTLKTTSKDDLPAAADEYHQHNVKVLDAVTTYFDSQSSILQSFIDATKSLINKAQAKTITQADISYYKNLVTAGQSKAALTDTKFISDLRALVGEEATLTHSFWQNNAILTRGDKVENDLNNLRKSLDSL